VCPHRGRQRNTPGDPRRRVRKPCCFSHVGREGFQIRVILADGFGRCRRTCPPEYKLLVLSRQPHVPAHNLITIPPFWLFTCWGLDMIGPLTTMPGGLTHVLVAIDKFTKWIGYKPIRKLSADRVVSFICDILHRFSFPNTIIMDLGSNFHSHEF
jgi:hypothetical protein